MHTNFFTKCRFQLNQVTGSQGATVILEALEYWFAKKPEGFYKFIEPCSHRLYRNGDSFVECLSVKRKSFWNSFKKIGTKYNSRTAFEEAADKFQGKMYASFYDRYTNQTFFIRNHEMVDEILKPYQTPQKTPLKKIRPASEEVLVSAVKEPLGIGVIGKSYMDAKNTSDDLSKDKSHAGNEIIASMIEIWKTRVDAKPVELTSRLIAFLKQAFKDKFGKCLKKWKAYCERIASSKFLMGESKSSFRVTLDWILKFDVIQKILAGNYGIGDRILPASVVTMEEVKASIQGEQVQEIKDFQETFLNIAGVKPYRSVFSNLKMELGAGKTLKLITQSSWEADHLERKHYSTLKLALEKSEDIQTLVIAAVGETEQKGRKIQARREGVTHLDPVAPMATDTPEILEEKTLLDAKAETGEDVIALVKSLEPEPIQTLIAPISCLTQRLQDKISAHHKYEPLPDWLLRLEVEDITAQGKVIICLEDEFAVGYCRTRYAGFILEECRKLWPQVSQVDIQQRREARQSDVKPCPQPLHGKAGLKNTPGSLLEEAIESLKAAFAPGHPLNLSRY